MMDADLALLLEIQEVRSKARELRSGTELGAFEEKHFGMDAAAAADALDARLSDLEDKLGEGLRKRYDTVAKHVDRVVVPVIDGMCYGCFVSIPTARAGDEAANAHLQSCEHCGRFLYILS